MSTDLALEQSLAQLRRGDTEGALAGLRRLAEAPLEVAAPGAPDEAGRLGRLDAACAEAEGADALRETLAAFGEEFPEWDEPWFRLARHLEEAGDAAGAEIAYGNCVERNPTRPEVLLALGELLLRRRALQPAAKLLRLCCALAPLRDEAWDALGRCLLLQGSANYAVGAFTKAQRLAPQRIDYALNRVEAALVAGRGDEELTRLEAACDEDPASAVHLTARAELVHRLGQRELAIDLLEAAATLAPDEKLPVAKLGERLTHSMRPAEADRALTRALALDPGNARLGIMHSVVLLRLLRYRDSIRLLEELIELNGEDSALLGNLSTATLALGRQEEAVAQARRAIELQPVAAVWRTLCNTLPYCDGVTAAELSEAARETSLRWPRDVVPAFTGTRDPQRRLRVGLLSGSLKMHPVGWLTVAGFEALDPEAFELVRLTAFTPPDSLAQRFANIAPEIHDTGLYDDHGLARHIRAIGIDILIELGGYGDLGRMAVCAYRAAPVQVKWVGMQNHTSGIPEIDWMITDRWETPPALEHFYTERAMRMPDGYVCYSPPPDAPDVAPLPALANGYVTFCCFSNLSKLTPRVLASWASLLHRMPDAKLLLKAPQFSEPSTGEDFLARFAAHGIGPERLILRGASPHRTLLGQYADVDILLDPFPYNGGLTTCEALWMGVPTVTLPGEIFASRHSLSHISNVGLEDWVASDLEDYLALAERKAGDLESLAALRAGLREKVRLSPLCDAPRFGRHLGAKLREAWLEYCKS